MSWRVLRVSNQCHWVVLSDNGLPTEDIYFLESAAPALRAQGLNVTRIVAPRTWGAVWRHGRNVLRQHAGAHVIVCRSLPPSWQRWLARHRQRFGYVAYLIDDDIEAAASDPTLPAAYRKRMAAIARRQPHLLQLCDEVVACSDALAERFTSLHERVSVLTPPLIASLPSLEHFAEPPSASSPWRVGFYGTRAHLQDLQHIAPALSALQQTQRGTHLEVMLGKFTPADIAELPNTTMPEPLPWQAFRRYQARQQVHIGLAPLLATRFNAGKSFIKFLDIAAMGGVGIYSNRYPYDQVVKHGINGLLVGDSPEEWQAALQQLIQHPAETARMARQAAQDAQRIGDPRHASHFWQARLGSGSVYQSGSK